MTFLKRFKRKFSKALRKEELPETVGVVSSMQITRGTETDFSNTCFSEEDIKKVDKTIKDMGASHLFSTSFKDFCDDKNIKICK